MTLNDVKVFVMSLKKGDEISVDDVASQSNFDRNTIMSAMKGLQSDGQGKFVVGRKGSKSRFLFGVQDVIKPVDQRVVTLATALTRLVENKRQQNPNDQIVINVDDLVAKFAPKDIVAAFGIMETNDVGIFLVGRKGAKSRFEVGRKRNEGRVSSKVSGSEYDLPPPEDGPFSAVDIGPSKEQRAIKNGDVVVEGFVLRVALDVVFLMHNVVPGYKTIDEAIALHPKFINLPSQDQVKLHKHLLQFGYLSLQQKN